MVAEISLAVPMRLLWKKSRLSPADTVMASTNCSFHDEVLTRKDALARCTSLSTVFCNKTRHKSSVTGQLFSTSKSGKLEPKLWLERPLPSWTGQKFAVI